MQGSRTMAALHVKHLHKDDTGRAVGVTLRERRVAGFATEKSRVVVVVVHIITVADSVAIFPH
jgi:hypothetical protein